MNKFFSFLLTLTIVLIAVSPFYLVADGLGDIREERTSLCKDLCIDKDMDFFDYDSKISGDIFCECLDNGTMKKFVLVLEGEK